MSLSKMKIYHWSDRDIEVVRPQYPKHHYTKRYSVPLAYFYKKKGYKEYLISGTKLYEGEISREKLYDFRKFKPSFSSASEISFFLKKLKKEGYKGAIYDSGFITIILFSPIKVKRIK